MLLIFCSRVSKNTQINEKGYLYDLNTYASYYPFSLCLLAPSNIAALKTLVIIWLTTVVGVETLRKRKKCALFCRCEMDANLI
jgi:hypothetical protein